MPTFGRVLTAMATPMTADLAIDFDGARQLARQLVDAGCDGLVVAGTTGESPTLSHAETLDLIDAVVEAVGARATVVAGCGKNDTAATVELTREASTRGVDGVMLVTPYYNKPTQRGLEAHFTAAAGVTDLPVLLYNIPSRTATEIAPETMLRIHEAAPNVCGVKDAVKDMDKASWVAAQSPDFEIYAGNDIDLLPLLSVGAVGVISVAAHLVARDLATLVEVFPTDPAKARAIHQRLLPLFAALFAEGNPVPLKAALDLVGLPGGPVRPPLATASDGTVAQLQQALQGVGVSA